MTEADIATHKRLAMVVPLYQLGLIPEELASLQYSLSNARCDQAIIVHPATLSEEAISSYLEGNGISTDMLGYEAFDPRFFRSLKTYNRLLLSVSFYERFIPFEYILICQPDAILIDGDLSKFLDSGKAFFGAPLFLEVGSDPLGYSGALNGGFSLRKVGPALKVLKGRGFHPDASRFCNLLAAYGIKNLAYLRILMSLGGIGDFKWCRMFVAITDINEDIFWSVIAQFFDKDYTAGNISECRSFSLEKSPAKEVASLGRLPHGAHAWYKYDREFWLANLPELMSVLRGFSNR